LSISKKISSESPKSPVSPAETKQIETVKEEQKKPALPDSRPESKQIKNEIRKLPHRQSLTKSVSKVIMPVFKYYPTGDFMSNLIIKVAEGKI